MRIKIKPPKETKAQLMEQIQKDLAARFTHPRQAIEFLLNFFTSADLVGIIEELKK